VPRVIAHPWANKEFHAAVTCPPGKGLLFLAVSPVKNERAKNSNPNQNDHKRVHLAIAGVDFDFKQSREIVDHGDPPGRSCAFGGLRYTHTPYPPLPYRQIDARPLIVPAELTGGYVESINVADMNKMPRPNLNDFFLRNVPLGKALDAIAKWEGLTEREREQLGFGTSTREHLEQTRELRRAG
jgi:hypothetical protein